MLTEKLTDQDLCEIADWVSQFAKVVPLSYVLEDASRKVVAKNLRRGVPLCCCIPFPGILGKSRGSLSIGLSEKHWKAEGAQLQSFVRSTLKELIMRRLERASLIALSRARKREMQFLGSFGEMPARNMDEFAMAMLQRIANMYGAQRASFMLVEGRKMRIAAAIGIPGEVWKGLSVEIGKGLSGLAAKTRQPILADDSGSLPPEVKELALKLPEGVGRTFICIPLSIDAQDKTREIVGVINLTDFPLGLSLQPAELSSLSAVATNIAVRIQHFKLVRQVDEVERVQQEMDLAARVQRNFLPQHQPRQNGLDISGDCVPAMWVGGDYYDWHSDADDLYLAVADVSGHGMGSALLMSMAHSLVKSMFWNKAEPSAIAHSLNLMVCRDAVDSGMFLTGFYARYNRISEALDFVNAGHVPGYLFRSGKRDPELLASEFLPAGIDLSVPYAPRSVVLRPGDTLILRTDGIHEATNGAGKAYGEEALIAEIQKRIDRPCREIIKGVRDSVGRFLNGISAQDDLTMLALRPARYSS